MIRPRVLPFEPFEHVMERRHRTVSSLGVKTARLVHRAALYQSFTFVGADLAACALDMHPSEIWGQDFYEVMPTT
jgi:lambda repressor-like predicted transcriptional regulator